MHIEVKLSLGINFNPEQSELTKFRNKLKLNILH